jgi:hypothetical protein
MRRALVLAALLALVPLTTQAQTPAPDLATSLQSRATALPQLLADGGDIGTAFTPDFIAAIPLAQIEQLFTSLRAQHGEPQRLVRLTRGPGAGTGTAIIAYARADITITLAVDATGRIAGMRIIDVAARDDTLPRIAQEIAALPGTTGWGIYRLGANAAPEQIAGAGDTAHLAIGSSFKLAVLGALDAEITAGRMQWDDVIRIDRRSVPSGMLHEWPHDTPITLQAAAQLMIAISDNTATDLLIHHIGRERIEAFARQHGGLSGPQAFPMLTTIEATVLKNPALGNARQSWLTGDEATRRATLASNAIMFVPANVDYSAFSRPADITRIEWFASADSMASLLSWYAHRASDTARDIISVNPGLPSAAAGRWDYVGYKGGSEPGVMAYNLLLSDAAGNSYAVVMSWNNENASVEENVLSSLAARAAALLRQQSAP